MTSRSSSDSSRGSRGSRAGARLPAALALLCAIGVASCGGADADDEIRQAADEFWTAVASGDGEVACALATAQGQAELAAVTGGEGALRGRTRCEAGAEILGRGTNAGAAEEWDEGEVIASGDVAAVESGAIGFCMPMRRSQGRWLADGVPPPLDPSSPECSP